MFPSLALYNIVPLNSRAFGAVVSVVMAKLSDLFGRKLSTAGPDNFTSRNGNGNGSDHISIESLSDVGSRIGEENEVLRNLLTDTGRKINELEDLKDAFDKLVAPFNSTLRALEQEKSQTRSTRQGRIEFCRSLCRTWPIERGSR